MPIRTDNRLFERVEGELGVRYSPHGSDGEFCTTTKNISGGGIRITLLKELAPGALVDLEIFRYNTNVKARCRGKIAWTWNDVLTQDTDSQRCEAGIEFIDRPSIYIGQLINYLESQKRLHTL